MKIQLSIILIFLVVFGQGNPCSKTLIPIEIKLNIIPDSIPNTSTITYEEYLNNYEIPAVITQTNQTDSIIELYLPSLFTFENIEIIDSKGEDASDLMNQYDYQIPFYPDDFEENFLYLKANESIIDTINLGIDLKLNRNDTFLIRIFKTELKQKIYSNWDTLIVY